MHFQAKTGEKAHYRRYCLGNLTDSGTTQMLCLYKDVVMVHRENNMTDDKDSQQKDGATVILCAEVFDTQRQLAHTCRQEKAASRLSARKRLTLRMLNKDRKKLHLRIIK